MNKHNERNPGKEIVYLNYAAVDPDLTNSKCSYWHFRLDADTSMKMEALTTFMKDQPEVKKVYLINQNYSHGQQVAKYAKEGTLPASARRADRQAIRPAPRSAQVRDFAPYVAKIKAIGRRHGGHRQLGSDLTLLIKAANDAGLKLPSSTPTTPTCQRHAHGSAAGGRRASVPGHRYGHVQRAGVRRSHPEWTTSRRSSTTTTTPPPPTHALALLSRRMAKAKSTDPGQGGAKAMEGMKLSRASDRRSRNAQGRPPAAAAAVHHQVARKADAKNAATA